MTLRLSLRNISAGYGRHIVLHDINVDIDEGLTVVLGPNGAGKTTLFRTICGVLKPMKGEILIDGVELNKYDGVRPTKLISYMPHGDALIRNLTVKEYILFWSKIHNLDPKEYDKVKEFLTVLGLGNCLNKKIDELSHGQKRKLALIRTLMMNAKIFLFDEPTSGLDIYSAALVHEIIKGIARNNIVLYSTHNLYEALKLADKVLILYDGRVVFYGSIDEIRRLVSAKKIKVRILNMDTVRREIEKLRNSFKKDMNIYKDHIVIRAPSEEEIASIVRRLVAIGADIVEVKSEDNPLEALIQELIGGRYNETLRQIHQ